MRPFHLNAEEIEHINSLRKITTSQKQAIILAVQSLAANCHYFNADISANVVQLAQNIA